MPQNFFQGFLAAGTGSASFVEETAVLYSRRPVTMGPLNAGISALQSSVSMYNGSAQVVTVTQRGLFDAAAGGNLIAWWDLATPRSIGSAQDDVETPASLQLQLSAVAGAAPPAVFAAGASIGTANGSPVLAGTQLQYVNGTVSALPGVVFASASSAAAPVAATTMDLIGSAAIPSTATSVDIRQTAAGTYTLPPVAAGTRVTVTDGTGNFATVNATLLPNAGETINGASSVVMAVNNESLTLNPDPANKNWEII